MSQTETEEIEIDAFLDSDESIEDLIKAEYDESWYFEKHGDGEDYLAELQPKIDTRELDDDDVLPDQRLIRGKGIAFSDLDTSDVTLDDEFTSEETMVATHADNDAFNDPALNAVYKSTVAERAGRIRASLDKKELLELAGDIVDEYFRKHVTTDGLDEAELNKIKFSARQRVARTLREAEN